MRQMTCSVIVAVVAAFMSMPPAAGTEEVRQYSGGLGMRPALSGDWGGARTELAGKGITFDMSLTQIGQGIVGGGGDGLGIRRTRRHRRERGHAEAWMVARRFIYHGG